MVYIKKKDLNILLVGSVVIDAEFGKGGSQFNLCDCDQEEIETI
jgi:hypothetical protein